MGEFPVQVAHIYITLPNTDAICRAARWLEKYSG